MKRTWTQNSSVFLSDPGETKEWILNLNISVIMRKNTNCTHLGNSNGFRVGILQGSSQLVAGYLPAIIRLLVGKVAGY